MTLRKIATAVGVVLAAAAGSANADVNSQLASLQAQVNQLQSQLNSSSGGSSMGSMVGLNSMLSWKMMGNYSGVGKELNILKARQSGLSTLNVGGQVQADVIYGHSDTNNKFINPVLNNYVPSGSSAGTTQNETRLALSNVSLATTASIGSWNTAYIQIGQTSIGNSFSNHFPSGTTPQSSSVAVQDAYLVMGNLSKLPVYGFVGYKDIDFGSFATVDMFNQPLTRTFFQAQGDTLGVGFNGYGFNGVFSLINGGNYVGVTNVTSAVQTQNLNTTNATNISNFAVNASYGMTNGMFTWNLGAGYLNGSAFENTSSRTNGAWDVNGKVSAMGFDLLGEYASTASQTNFTTTVANQDRTQAWSVGADYNFPIMGYKTVLNAEYSQFFGAQGNGNQAYQYVLGYRVQPVKSVWTGLEYAYNKGYLANTTANTTVLTGANNVFNDNVHNSSLVLDVTAMF